MNGIKAAILVDGAFYTKRAKKLFGIKDPEERAQELFSYCLSHLAHPDTELYRIFYYDCHPAAEIIFNPISGENIILKKSLVFKWMTDFIHALREKRKVALRLGRIAVHSPYILEYKEIKKLCAGELSWSDIKPDDIRLNMEQKGVDMRIGVDIASLAFKRQVNQIILISGDSDFVPAAKLARREGIDFILDAMGAHVADDLSEHIDGFQTRIKKFIPQGKKIP